MLPGRLDYEQYVGLVMEGQRTRLRKVYFQGLAHSLANGAGEIPEEIAIAACEFTEAGKRLAFEINAARAARQMGF